MEQVCNILRVLLRRALSEHGREAPALIDVVVERASGGFEPRLGVHFSNGYCTWAPIRAADCYPFCERHQAWDLASLRTALLREAQTIYAQLCAERLAELTRAPQRRRGVTAFLDRIRRRTRARDQQAAEPALALPDLGGRPLRHVAEWFALQRNDYARNAFFGHSLMGDIGSKRAQERGIQLLKENLAPPQLRQYERHGYFDVVGGRTGKRYRIRHGRQMNIEQLDRNGRRVCGWCFYPHGSLVAGDVMLAQKIALELFEVDALRIANRF